MTETQTKENRTMQLIPFLTRDRQGARIERQAGQHHCFYWCCNIKKALEAIGCKTSWLGSDPVRTGAHYLEFSDPDTGQVYEVTILPKMEG